MHNIIRNSVAFFFGQFLAKAAHKFACTSQRECDGKTQHVPTSPHPPIREQTCQWIVASMPPYGQKSLTGSVSGRTDWTPRSFDLFLGASVENSNLPAGLFCEILHRRYHRFILPPRCVSVPALGWG